MALKGNLRDFSTTQLLNLINLAKKSGTLFIEASDNMKANVSFKGGKLIYASMGGQDGNLALVLAQFGKLTQEQAKLIAERAKDASDKQIGLELINRGYVTQADIVQSIKSHLHNIVLKLFGWEDGAFHFDADTMPPPGRITVPVELENLIMQGSRRLKELDRLEEELPNLDMALKFPGQPSAKLGKVNLSVEEWKVISFVKPENTMRMIAKAHNLSDLEIRKIVYSLLQAGLVELTRPAGADAARVAASSTRRVRQAQSPLQATDAKAKVVNKLIERIRAL
jgi:hypothetical protein